MRRRLVLLAVPAVLACETLTGTFDEVIALQVEGSTTRRIEEGDTIRLVATALDIGGSPVAADIRWSILDTVPGLTLDSTTGTVVGVTPGGPWRVQAQVGSLRASAIAVTVAGAPDSTEAVGDTLVTITGAVGSFGVRIFDLTTTPGTATLLAGASAHFRLIDPPGSVRLRAPTDADSLARDTLTVTSGANGVATAIAVVVGTAPDSIHVEATVTTALGGAVAGSPIRFLLRFP